MALQSFDPQIAARVGVSAAAIYNNMLIWSAQDRSHGNPTAIDSDPWRYMSAGAWQKLFPYLTLRQIGTALNKLRAEGLIGLGDRSE